MITKLILTSLLITAQVGACIGEGSTGIVPENDLRIPVGQTTNKFMKVVNNSTSAGLNEKQYNEVIDHAVAIYKSEFKEQLSLELKVEKLWDNGTVNAGTNKLGNQALVKMYGGFARHSLTTADSFSLVLCHEFGHHLAGAPRYTGRWASTEGQSDYFAVMKCFKKLHAKDDNQKIVSKLNLHEHITEQCQISYTNANDLALCQRTLAASKSLADTFQSLMLNAHEKKTRNSGWFSKKPKPLTKEEAHYPWFTTPWKSAVSKTYEGHPRAQCRLDTYTAGALCDLPVEENFDAKDPDINSCNRRNGDQIGPRPLCWFRPSA